VKGSKLLTTGIETLDVQLRGGFPAGTTVLILFDPGAAHEVFAAHLTSGGLKSKEKVCYVNTDSPVGEIEEILTEYGVDVEKCRKSGMLEFIDIYTTRYSTIFPPEFLTSSPLPEFYIGGSDPLSLLRSIITDPERRKGRIIVDTLSYFLRSYELKDVSDLVEFMGVYSKASENLSILFMSRGMHEENVENTMKHLCDTVIELLVREEGDRIRKYMKFLKMRGATPQRNLIPYEVTERGIEIETTRRLL